LSFEASLGNDGAGEETGGSGLEAPFGDDAAGDEIGGSGFEVRCADGEVEGAALWSDCF
jgi:hypothetical protein